MALLSKSDLLTGAKLQTMELDLPELGGALKLREPSSAAAFRVQALRARAMPKQLPNGEMAPGEDTETDLLAEMLCSTVLDENNNLAFTRAEALQVIDRIPLAAMQKIIGAFNQLATRTQVKPEAPEGAEPNPTKPS